MGGRLGSSSGSRNNLIRCGTTRARVYFEIDAVEFASGPSEDTSPMN